MADPLPYGGPPLAELSYSDSIVFQRSVSSLDPHMNESCPAYESVTSLTQTSHTPHINKKTERRNEQGLCHQTPHPAAEKSSAHRVYRGISTFHTAQEWKNRTPNATNYSIVHFLLLPGSQWSFTEITEYVYFSLI